MRRLTFAAFAGKCVVVVAARPVTAHEAELLLLPRRWAFLLLFRLAAIAGVAVQTARRGQIFTACIREKKKEGDKEPN